MNTIELLKKAAEIEKKACVDFISNYTQAGIVALVKGGMKFEKAAETMRQACENETSIFAHKTNAIAFEKAAEYISELEAKVSELTKVAEEAELEAKTLDEQNPLNKLASLGFTKEEIEVMAQMPNQLVEKVASVNSQPWEMGNAVGMAREKTDPLLEFLLN